MMPSAVKTIKVRVRDKHAAVPRAMAYETNQVWKCCAELRMRVARERGRWLSGYDLQHYTIRAPGGSPDGTGRNDRDDGRPHRPDRRRRAAKGPATVIRSNRAWSEREGRR